MNRRKFITSIAITGFANLFLPRLASKYLWKAPRTEVGLNAWEFDGKLVHVPIPHGLDAALERQQKLWQEARKMLIREFDLRP